MSEKLPTFKHNGFRPNIKKKLSDQDLEVMEDWQMSTVGVPVPTYHNAKAAIWYAQSENLAEIPVLSIMTPDSIRSRAAQWFIGLTQRCDHLDHDERLQHFADAAQFVSPNGVFAAIAGLRQLLGDNDAVFNNNPYA